MSTEIIFSSEEDTSLEEILTRYFYAGFTYTEILEFLNMYHGHQIKELLRKSIMLSKKN